MLSKFYVRIKKIDNNEHIFMHHIGFRCLLDTTEHKEERDKSVLGPVDEVAEVVSEVEEKEVSEFEEEVPEHHFEEGADKDSDIEEGQESNYGI